MYKKRNKSPNCTRLASHYLESSGNEVQPDQTNIQNIDRQTE